MGRVPQQPTQNRIGHVLGRFVSESSWPGEISWNWHWSLPALLVSTIPMRSMPENTLAARRDLGSEEVRHVQLQFGNAENLVESTRSNCRLCKIFWVTASVETLRRVFSIDNSRGRGFWRAIHFDAGTSSFTKINLEAGYFQLLPITCKPISGYNLEGWFGYDLLMDIILQQP